MKNSIKEVITLIDSIEDKVGNFVQDIAASDIEFPVSKLTNITNTAEGLIRLLTDEIQYLGERQ